MITNGLWTVFSLNGTFFLSMYADSKNTLADLKVASVLPGCLSIISSSIGLFVTPYFIKNEAKKKWIWNNYLKIIGITFIVLLTASIGIIIFENYVITFIYGDQYLTVIPCMNLLLISAIINGSFRYPVANIFAAMGLVKYNIISAIIGISCQILLSYIFVPYLHEIGTAITEISVYLIMALFLNCIFIKKYKNDQK